jgi:hypothetical protein
MEFPINSLSKTSAMLTYSALALKNVAVTCIEKGFSPLGARVISLLNNVGTRIPQTGAFLKGFPSYQAASGIFALVASAAMLRYSFQLASYLGRTAQIEKRMHGTTSEGLIKRAVSVAIATSSIALALFVNYYMFKGAISVFGALRAM